MARARLRFHGELRALLAPALRAGEFEHALAPDSTLKHLVEALGVPHTEIGEVRVDGAPAALDAPVSDGDSIDVHPAPACTGAGAPPRFLADAHLGALARRLRLLGFDTALAGGAPDAELAARADAEDRIVLTRDRELLKHRRVRAGRLLRSRDIDGQLDEVARRFGLAERAAPFSRCLECNGVLAPASREDVAAALPPRVAREQHEFTRCADCGRVYWPGSHWRRLRAKVEAILAGRLSAP